MLSLFPSANLNTLQPLPNPSVPTPVPSVRITQSHLPLPSPSKPLSSPSVPSLLPSVNFNARSLSVSRSVSLLLSAKLPTSKSKSLNQSRKYISPSLCMTLCRCSPLPLLAISIPYVQSPPLLSLALGVMFAPQLLSEINTQCLHVATLFSIRMTVCMRLCKNNSKHKVS